MGKRLYQWLCASPDDTQLGSVILWWEYRRIPFNAIIGVYGIVCLITYLWAITTSGRLQPGDDAVEPIALIAAPIGINILYTLGWLTEVPARIFVPKLSIRFGPILLMVGIGMGFFLISIPAVVWLGIRLMQFAGFAN